MQISGFELEAAHLETIKTEHCRVKVSTAAQFVCCLKYLQKHILLSCFCDIGESLKPRGSGPGGVIAQPASFCMIDGGCNFGWSWLR